MRGTNVELTCREAVAGAGKTTRIFEIIQLAAEQGQEVLYMAYNVSVQKEGDHSLI